MNSELFLGDVVSSLKSVSKKNNLTQIFVFFDNCDAAIGSNANTGWSFQLVCVSRDVRPKIATCVYSCKKVQSGLKI